MPEIFLKDEKSHEHRYTGNEPNLGSQHTFVQYKIESGKWILYVQPDYNTTIDTPESMLLNFDGVTSGFQQLPPKFSPRSLRNFEETANSCILFEHRNYCGHAKTYTKACPDVTRDFPSGGTGVSSVIIWQEKNWELFEGKNYQGGYITLDPTQYPYLMKENFEDLVESLKPVESSAKQAGKN